MDSTPAISAVPEPEQPPPSASAMAASTATPATTAARSSRRIIISVTPRTIWLALALLIFGVILLVVLSKVISALILVFIALILAEGIRPLVNWLYRRAHIPRPIGVLLIYLVAALVIGFLTSLLIDPVAKQIAQFATDMPTYIDHAQRFLTQIEKDLAANPGLQNFLKTVVDNVGPLIGQTLLRLITLPLNAAGGIFGSFFSVVVIITLALFWLSTTQALKPFVLDLFPETIRGQADSIIREMSQGLGGYLIGTLIDMFIIGILTGVGLAIIGVPYALLLGILAGLTEMIPYLGPWISGSVAVVVTLISSDLPKALVVIIFFMLLQQLEGNTITPLVMSRAVHVNPFTVLVAVIIGAQLLGIVGAVLAVPAAALIQITIVRVLAPLARRARQTTADVSFSTVVAQPPAPPDSQTKEPAKASTPPAPEVELPGDALPSPS